MRYSVCNWIFGQDQPASTDVFVALNTVAQIVEFVAKDTEPKVGLVLDAHQIQIKEANSTRAILDLAERLFLFQRESGALQ